MNDQSKVGRNHQYEGAGIARLELMQSESPKVQQKLLLQQLSQEIVNTQRIRYREAELHFKNQNGSLSRQSPSDQQHVPSSALIGLATSCSTELRSPQNSSKPQSGNRSSRRNSSTATVAKTNEDSSETIPQRSKTTTKNCQVCLIKAVRQDLMNINKIVQERNEQISKLLDPILSPAR